MASSDTELEEQLLEAGNKLIDPPSSVEDLLPLLDVSTLFQFFNRMIILTFVHILIVIFEFVL